MTRYTLECKLRRDTNLHQTALAVTSLDEGLGDPASRVRCAAVHLGEVLAGESSPAVRSPPAVRVHNDLTARQTGVTLMNKRSELSKTYFCTRV